MDTSPNANTSTKTELLERKLSLQQLQVNRLLEITQAVNNNFSRASLFKLYTNTLTWEMSIQKFALFSKDGDGWHCAASVGIDESALITNKLEESMRNYTRSSKIQEDELHPLLQQFHFIIPVYHKDNPIAFTVLGNELFDDPNRDDVYETIRFISAITNVIAVAIENKRLFKRQLEQERLKRDMELAVQVQNMLIPSTLPKNDRFEFASIYRPHKGVGGDYYDFMELGQREIAFCIADISGKGIAAALLMSNFQANLQSLIHRKYLSVKEFAMRLNELVLRTTKGEKFITFFLGRYHLEKRRLRYLNAGHNPPLMYTQGKIHQLDKGCTILGAFDKLPFVDFGEIYLEDDALFLLYTDGLTDLLNEQEEFYDEKKLEDFMQRNHHLGAQEFNDTLMAEISEFKGNRGFPDDISVLSGRIFVPKGTQEPTDEQIDVSC